MASSLVCQEVNPMDTNGIETTTWHDQKPSHNPKPGNLVQLEAAMENGHGVD